MDLAKISYMFLFISSKKFNDNMQAFLNKVFKSLVEHINE